ncbi:hypothetical protein Syun_012088 [Stephania yunnanensis]|uniref:Uncharacterized protein n=1 Tax=Stephania yunnanensis TaxID=152371 RepID=A0AAP0PEY8_9MAGN
MHVPLPLLCPAHLLSYPTSLIPYSSLFPSSDPLLLYPSILSSTHALAFSAPSFITSPPACITSSQCIASTLRSLWSHTKVICHLGFFYFIFMCYV